MASSPYITEAQATALVGKIDTSLGQVTDVYAAKEGVKADGSTDNTAALKALAQKYQQPVGSSATNRRVRIHLSDRGITRGHLPMAPGIVWVGGELRPPTGGATQHLVYPLTSSWLYATDGSGAHRGGLEGIRINGERGSNKLNMSPAASAPTVTAQAGSLTSGDYGYAIGYLSPIGYSRPSDFVQVYGATGAKLTWTNTNTWDQVVVWGRDPWTQTAQKVLATLPAGTTTWTDDGSATPSVGYWSNADLTAPSVVIAGAAVHLRDVEITELPGSVYSTWRSTNPGLPNEPGYVPMESMWERIAISGIQGSVVFDGPHDSHWHDVIIAGAAAKDAAKFDAYVVEQGGPLKVARMHVWYDHRRGIAVFAGPTSFVDCASEGARDAAVYIQEHNVAWQGGEVFYPNGPSAKGFVVNNKHAQIDNVHAWGFSSASGPAFDLTSATTKYVKVHGIVEQASGTMLAGLTTGKHDVHLIQTTTGGPASVVNRLSSFTA